ncbi:hypothetical protein CNMCM8694_009230 [Aspergillus lentulus]|nr:hypothetical protein CNMCM8060_004601 [Aspergillus lentulus]KAF4198517.1 hypothetical protein CNMCM8694_009230 [Aspergillus lentulus]
MAIFPLTRYTTHMGASGLTLNFLVTGIATCAFWLFGYDMSVMGGLITEESFTSVFPEMTNANVQGIVIASFELGALAGALACLDLGDRLGRRLTVWFGMFFMLTGGTLQTSAWALSQLALGRVLSGIGLGLQVATVPSWQAECAKAHSRGRWVMIEGGLQTFGVACGQLVGYGFFFVKGQAQWRAPVGIQLFPALIVFIFINFLPESPRWLIKHGLVEEGTYNLSKLRNLPVDHPELVFERDAIIASFEAQSELAPFSYREMLTNGKTKMFHRVAIGFFMQSAQQLSGINLVSTYANKILQESFGLAASTSHLIAAVGGLEYAACSLLSVLLIEGLGRRRAFLWTTVGMSCCFAVIAGLQSTDSRTCQLTAAGFLFLFNTFFGLAWVGGPFLYSAEIAPLRCRAQANAFASAGNWLFCFVVVMIIPPAFQNIGWKTYIIFAILNACFVPIIYFFLVETRKRSLEELDVIFAAGGDPVKKEKTMPPAQYPVTTPVMPPALAVRLTCQACTRRKVKCDKKSPCTNCLKHGISCVAVERPRWPRGRSGKQAISREQDLSNRVAKLEQMIQEFTHSKREMGDVSSSRGDTTIARSGRSPKLQSETARRERDTENHPGLPSEPVRRRILVDIFLRQVDPVLKILHRPSLCAYLLEGKPYLDYAPGHPVPAALASAVFYMASSTLAEDQCLALLAERKETVLARYSDETKAALAKVDFLVTNHLAVLQAFVLSLVAARTHDTSRKVWTMLSVALRIAQALSLHMTDPPFPVTPFEREMRRRLWHLIGWLDLEASLNRGSESMMRSAWIQTHSLTNINDDDFGFDSKDPLPAAQSGPTEATLLIMFAHGQCALRTLDLSNFAEPGITDVHMRQQTVDHFRRTTKELLVGCDPENVPFHWFMSQIQEQISAVLQLIALRPLQRSPTFVPAELPVPQMLALAADILERRQRMFSDPRAQPWRWFELLYFPWHALVVAMTEVCVCTDRWVIDRYWPTLERSYDLFQQPAVGTHYDWLLAPMERLMDNARAARQKLVDSDTTGLQAPNSHLYMGMASLEGPVLSESLPPVPDASLAAEELTQLQDQEASAWAQYGDFTDRFYELQAIFDCGLT